MAFGLPGGWLRDTAALYARVFRRGAELALRNWWVGLVVIVYAVLLGMVAVVTAPLGLVGGLLRYLALVACFSCRRGHSGSSARWRSASCSTSRRSYAGCSSRSCRRRTGGGGSSSGARRGSLAYPCCASRNRSASIAAMQPVPAAVTAWR